MLQKRKVRKNGFHKKSHTVLSSDEDRGVVAAKAPEYKLTVQKGYIHFVTSYIHVYTAKWLCFIHCMGQVIYLSWSLERLKPAKGETASSTSKPQA